MITNYFSRDPQCDEAEPNAKKIKTNDTKKTNATSAYRRTCDKWVKEFKIDLQFEQDGDVVKKMWCRTCVEFPQDKSSTVK